MLFVWQSTSFTQVQALDAKKRRHENFPSSLSRSAFVPSAIVLPGQLRLTPDKDRHHGRDQLTTRLTSDFFRLRRILRARVPPPAAPAGYEIVRGTSKRGESHSQPFDHCHIILHGSSLRRLAEAIRKRRQMVPANPSANNLPRRPRRTRPLELIPQDNGCDAAVFFIAYTGNRKRRWRLTVDMTTSTVHVYRLWFLTQIHPSLVISRSSLPFPEHNLF